MKYTVTKMKGGVADVWYMVIMPDDDFNDYAKRVANYCFRTPKVIDKNLREFLDNGFLPIQYKDRVKFLFDELEIPGECLGIISRTAAKLFGSTNDYTT